MYWYYILYMFESLGWRVSEFLFVAIILRIFTEERNNKTGATSSSTRPWSLLGLVCLGLLTTAGLGLYVARMTYNIIDNSEDGFSEAQYRYHLDDYSNYIGVAYDSLLLLITFLIIGGFVHLYLSTRSIVCYSSL
jgi:hypothetical protein